MTRPHAIDLYCGLGGWSAGLIAEGYAVTGYDIEAHAYDGERYPGELVLADVRTLHGAQFKHAAIIVASPPCQEFSYMAMPWKRAKQIARALRGQDEFPAGYTGSRTIEELTALFDACFRIKREASEAAGRDIPLVVENVRGAQPWVGRAKWNFGSYYLWGDVPALMPSTKSGLKFNPDGSAHGQGSWFAVADSKERGVKRPGRTMCFPEGSENPAAVSGRTGKLHWKDDDASDGRKNPGFRFDGSGKSFQSESVARHVEGQKMASTSGRSPAPGNGARFTSVEPGEGRKGAGAGAEWFDANLCALPSRSSRRKAASAKIAKIPFALSAWIARTYKTMERVT